MNILCGGYK